MFPTMRESTTDRSWRPRGVLNLRGLERNLRLLREFPSEDLAYFIEHYWMVRWDRRGIEPYRQETLPHPSIHVTIQPEGSHVIGVMRGKFSTLLCERSWVFGIKFRPGAFHPFLRSPVSVLTDRRTPLETVFGADGTGLEAAILATAEDDDAKVAIAEDFLRRRLPERDETLELIDGIVRRIMADREIIKVDDLVERTHLNKRTLQRIFSRYVGVSPKWVINRYRLHEAAEQLADGRVKEWPALALELGYFDQAHFIRDFKAIIGVSPAEYARTIGAAGP
jgi:AraC-like DNA-binding protein